MNKEISFRFTIIMIFSFLSLFIIMIMFGFQYIFSEKLAKNITLEKFETMVNQIEADAINRHETNIDSIEQLAKIMEYYNINNAKDTQNNKYKLLDVFSAILNNKTRFYAIYIGDKDNNYFEVIKLTPFDDEKYNTTSNEKWALIEVKENDIGYKYISFYDKNLHKTRELRLQDNYLVSARPWFKEANVSVTKISPYEFTAALIQGVMGMTYTKKINENTVLAIDLLIDDIKNYLKESSKVFNTEFYMYSSNDKQLIIKSQNASSSIVLNDILKNKNDYLYTDKNGETFIYKILNLNQTYIILLVNLNEAKSEYSDKFKYMIYITIGVILLLLPFIFYMSMLISKPIIALVKNTILIKEHKFNEIKTINSRVKEISQLASSITDMADSIHDYQTNLESKIRQRTEQLEEKNNELQLLSITDRLTGIFNRIKIDEVLEQHMENANDFGVNFGLIMIDIDHFKAVNDTYGHNAGDIVLKEFASIIKRNVRSTDTFGRWGGEEFMIICVDVNLEILTKIANKFKKLIEEHDFSIIHKKTASFGVSIYKQGEKVEQMVDRADKALYKAKENGRNQVVNESEV
ncbi:MAG: diguanylate cyclase [Campylobacter sputorum]|uniref:GGDEF domain-containing protein n=2 Tax=Campylobacter sputorum TaxID=206 RepID=UPI000B7889EA|nr:GGDEF domain-containing protein [Campylobacter sputorum]ASM38202.1 diguanylate cyclase [Campylobacter sputorum bv. paraureolyticus LMG 11764]ASM39085.1 diguanylate cyclase [Campylobacter sputorum bv. paraureolyticus LMG 11764]MDY6120118.1 diguanylate cyclase [Campylobacter sputorum]